MKTAFFSDIHGNTPALEAVLEDIHREGVDQAFLLGDIINGVDPHGCMRLLANWGTLAKAPLVCIQGNAEMYLLTADLDALPNFGAAWETEVLCLIRWFEAHLSADDLDRIRSFPDYLLWGGAFLGHDSPVDRLLPESWYRPGIALKYQEWFHHSHGIEEDMPTARWQQLSGLMESNDFTYVFCGHTHVPLIKRLGHRIICNTGSVGLPLDGDPRAAWVMVQGPLDQNPTISIKRAAYDIDRTCKMIDDTPDYLDSCQPGFQKNYKLWLRTGSRIE